MAKIKLINPLVRHSVIKTTNAQQWAYSLGNLGCALPYQAIGAVLLFFYVDVHTMAPMKAAAVMTGYAIYNALNNPLMGYLSDRTKTIWGRRIPYVLFGTIPYALFFSILFLVPFSGSDHPIALLVWFILGLFLFETMATIVQTTYYAAYPEMFSEYKDRTSIATSGFINVLMSAWYADSNGQNRSWPAGNCQFKRNSSFSMGGAQVAAESSCR